jgi:SAM-dependent methyltransferase
MKRRVDLLHCLRCGHEPLSRQGPIARCHDCGRAYPLRRAGLVDFLPEQEDDDHRSSRLINPRHWFRKTRESYRQRVAPPDPDLHRILAQQSGGIFLHLGCGAGLILEEAARHPWRLRIGVARKLKRLMRAHRQPNGGTSLLLLRCSPSRLPLRDKTVDTVLLQSPFIELKDPQAAIFELVRILCPEGRLICRVERNQEEQLSQILSVSGFAYYRVGVWWVSRRLGTQESPLANQAL